MFHRTCLKSSFKFRPSLVSATKKVCTHLSKPVVAHPTCFIASNATVQGDVRMGAGSSVFYNCVLRADINTIEIGECSNVQDSTVIHLASNRGVEIGDYVTIGHKAMIHACTVEDNVLIGMGAILMDNSRIQANSIVGAGSLVPIGKTFPPNSLIMGSPAKRIRALTEDEVNFISKSAEKYTQVASEHLALQESR